MVELSTLGMITEGAGQVEVDVRLTVDVPATIEDVSELTATIEVLDDIP